MNKKSEEIISRIANLERELIRVEEVRQVHQYIDRGLRVLTNTRDVIDKEVKIWFMKLVN